MLAGVMTLAASAQSTNPLNYSGTMYVESITAIETPRYISYEEHAILSEKMTLPMTEVTKIVMDFGNNTIYANGKVHDIKVTGCKRYDTDWGWEVVIYFEYVGGDKLELVWKEFGKPYLQEITNTGTGASISRITLSASPTASSSEDVLRSFLQGLATY